MKTPVAFFIYTVIMSWAFIIFIQSCTEDESVQPTVYSSSSSTSFTTQNIGTTNESALSTTQSSLQLITQQDIKHVDLNVHLTTDGADISATYTIEPNNGEVTLDVGDITINGISQNGTTLDYETHNNQIHFSVADSYHENIILIEYEISQILSGFGYYDTGSTTIFPDQCHQLYPCVNDGYESATFSLQLHNVPTGKTAVYPTTIEEEAAMYQIGWSLGDYTEETIGFSNHNTEVKVWYFDGHQAEILDGTEYVLDVLNILETNFGGYPYGDELGAVEVEKVIDSYPNGGGAVENHPYWHIVTEELSNQNTHIHELIHGWIGNNMRLHCWEDYALIDGMTEYLAIVFLGEAMGETEGNTFIQNRRNYWQNIYDAESYNGEAYPSSCNEIDVMDPDLSSIYKYYIQGTILFFALEDEIGRNTLINLLAGFYQEHVNSSVSWTDFLAVVGANTSVDTTALVNTYLHH